jgi:histidine triad (HIT) family protein
MEDCLFCRISAGETDTDLVVDTEETVAFLDADPASLGHTLVVPKQHHEFLFRNEAALEAVFRTTRRVESAIEQTLAPDGVSLFYTSGPLVGTVTHAHVHLVPRYPNDDIHVALARDKYDHDTEDGLAEQLCDNV